MTHIFELAYTDPDTEEVTIVELTTEQILDLRRGLKELRANPYCSAAQHRNWTQLAIQLLELANLTGRLAGGANRGG